MAVSIDDVKREAQIINEQILNETKVSIKVNNSSDAEYSLKQLGIDVKGKGKTVTVDLKDSEKILKWIRSQDTEFDFDDKKNQKLLDKIG